MAPAHSLTIPAEVFDPASVSEATHTFNAGVRAITAKVTKWYVIGAPMARQLRREGKGAFPGPTLLPSASSIEVPSRDAGRSIPCRLLKPQGDKAGSPRAVYMNIHGGGWTLSDEISQDPYLQALADDHNITCVSVGYRLAPENPFPAGPHDCFDVAEWLVGQGEAELGAPLGFIGGESAGAHLSALTILHLLQHETSQRLRDFRFRGAVFNYGCFSLEMTPSVHMMGGSSGGDKEEEDGDEGFMVLDKDLTTRFIDGFLAGMTPEQRRDPKVSPLFADLRPLRGRLPPALFTVGTEDLLVDDTVLMSTRWLAAGADTRLEIVPGAPHGFVSFPRAVEGSGADRGLGAQDEFLRERLEEA